jgi:cellulose synthase/poly-beta-1,6-N-acetylglucosamine synthase-like glycosyltransferase
MDIASSVDGLVLSIALFAVLHNAWAIGNIAWAARWLSRRRAMPFPEAPHTFVVLLLPMLDEQSVVEEAIEHFLGLDYPADLYRIVVVTSAREHARDAESTGDLVERVVAAHPGGRVLHFHADGSDGCKADQLNQALRWLDATSPCWWTADAVVGVYDADSRPESHTLRDLDRAAGEHPAACAFQQPAVYVSGFDRLPGGLRGAYLRSRPLYNLRFCLYREVPGFARSIVASRSGSPVLRTLLSSPNHFLGHGEFIRARTLRSVGGFPPPSADTSLGTLLSFLGHALVPLSTFDVGETPTSIGMLIRQGATWYAGCALYLHDLRLALAKGARLAPRHVVMIVKRWLENMIWCVGPLLLLLAGTWALCRDQHALLIACAGGAALHGLSVVLVLQTYLALAPGLRVAAPVPRPSPGQYVGALLAYPIMLLGTCLGPLLHYAHRLRGALTGRIIPRSKTTRVAETASIGREPGTG